MTGNVTLTCYYGITMETCHIWLRRYDEFGPDRLISPSDVWRIVRRLDLSRLPSSQRYKRHKERWKRYEKPLPGPSALAFQGSADAKITGDKHIYLDLDQVRKIRQPQPGSPKKGREGYKPALGSCLYTIQPRISYRPKHGSRWLRRP